MSAGTKRSVIDVGCKCGLCWGGGGVRPFRSKCPLGPTALSVMSVVRAVWVRRGGVGPV